MHKIYRYLTLERILSQPTFLSASVARLKASKKPLPHKSNLHPENGTREKESCFANLTTTCKPDGAFLNESSHWGDTQAELAVANMTSGTDRRILRNLQGAMPRNFPSRPVPEGAITDCVSVTCSGFQSGQLEIEYCLVRIAGRSWMNVSPMTSQCHGTAQPH